LRIVQVFQLDCRYRWISLSEVVVLGVPLTLAYPIGKILVAMIRGTAPDDVETLIIAASLLLFALTYLIALFVLGAFIQHANRVTRSI
jgi:hypothetical protein